MSALRRSLRRVTTYSTLGALALGLVVVLEEVVAELLEAGLGIDSLRGSVLAGLLIALSLVPAHAGLRRLLDRLQ